MSGSSWCSWALGAGVAKKSLQLAEALGCGVDVKTCLKNKTVEEIYEGVRKVEVDYCDLIFFFHGACSEDLKIVQWGAVIDGEFIQHPDEMAAAAPPKVSIVGLTNKEAAVFSLVDIAPEVHKLSVKAEDYPKWSRKKLISTLTRLISVAYSGIHLEEIINDVIAFYVDRGEEENHEFYIDRYTEFLSDLLFNMGIANGVIARRDAGWDVYAFVLDHHNDAIWNSSIPVKLRGAPHASELPYTNGVGILGNFEFDENEQIIADVFQQSIIEFAKIG
ncbi:hypothetical protein OESDEN_23103 [Oesophagostomum dentatum]|uniref:Carboxylesterase type B domain-containing protein n=1 Tax=Oesophagostomum dentatum TaxID=61180 RepID=A0A0B1S1A0_OESDE|nr:hypothetical protein OESDEN_23103 [Oesophagostomum dentatum]